MPSTAPDVTMPVDRPIVASVGVDHGAPIVHEPPPTPSPSVVVLPPSHNDSVPVIAEGSGVSVRITAAWQP